MPIGWPMPLPSRSHTPNSSSKSSIGSGPKRKSLLPGAGMNWPVGRTTGVPLTTTELARPL